jgi:hypothetical protein
MRLPGITAPAFALTFLTALALAAALAGGASAGTAATRVGVDVITDGNTATTLGPVDECVEIKSDETQQVDVFVENVTDLIAWEALLNYDPDLLVLEEHDTALFQAANQGSDVQDVSQELPDGRYTISAFDSSDPPAPDTGSGVLARLTFAGVGAGVSEVSLPLTDIDGDGMNYRGPLLKDQETNAIGDSDGDSFLDEPAAGARIAVDASCSDPLGPKDGSESADEGSDDDDIDILTVVVIVAGLAGAVGVGGLATLIAVRRMRRPK